MRNYEKLFKDAMWKLIEPNVIHYIWSNQKNRANGWDKAHHHSEITCHYISVFMNCDKDDVYGNDAYKHLYDAVHDTTAELLTNHLDREINFDWNQNYDPSYNSIFLLFFNKFHKIACDILTKG